MKKNIKNIYYLGCFALFIVISIHNTAIAEENNYDNTTPNIENVNIDSEKNDKTNNIVVLEGSDLSDKNDNKLKNDEKVNIATDNVDNNISKNDSNLQVVENITEKVDNKNNNDLLTIEKQDGKDTVLEQNIPINNIDIKQQDGVNSAIGNSQNDNKEMVKDNIIINEELNSKPNLPVLPKNISQENNVVNIQGSNDDVIPKQTLKKLEEQVIKQSEGQETQEQQEIDKMLKEQSAKIINEIKNEENKAQKEQEKQEQTSTTSTNVIDNTETKKDSKTKKKDEDKNATKENKDDIDFDKIFTVFDTKKALDFDYSKIKYSNFALLENIEELKEIKKAIADSLDIEHVKKQEEKRKKQQSNQTGTLSSAEKYIENSLRIYSLVYFNDKDWKAKVNLENVNYETKDKKNFNGASIVKSNKTSIIFLLQKPNTKVDLVRKIQEEHGSYSQNYYLVREGKDIYIAFKLFIGQRINLDTMKITG